MGDRLRLLSGTGPLLSAYDAGDERRFASLGAPGIACTGDACLVRERGRPLLESVDCSLRTS